MPKKGTLAVAAPVLDEVAELKSDIAALDRKLDEARNERYAAVEARRAAEKSLEESRQHFADLKIRLTAAETANQFMRGYLARVQEDDVVNEDLVTTGDPGGDQRLVPKRKPTPFPRPDDFTQPIRGDEYGRTMTNEERRRAAKHWVTY